MMLEIKDVAPLYSGKIQLKLYTSGTGDMNYVCSNEHFYF